VSVAVRGDGGTGPGGGRAHFAAGDTSLYPVLVGVFVGLLLISTSPTM